MIILKWLAFSIDIPSLVTFLQTTLGSSFIAVQANPFDLRILTSVMPSSNQVSSIKGYMSGLTQSGEAAKRALPSRVLTSPSTMGAALAAVKAGIAAKPMSSWNPAEVKFVMGADLSPTEMDTLTIPAATT